MRGRHTSYFFLPMHVACGYRVLSFHLWSIFNSDFVLEQYTLERGVVHACHAGGVVHFLEGWQHHEVGALRVDQIDVVWEAALRHGLKPM